ncbi:diguanylate cyclase [Pseudorhodoferax sp. Leaf274]|uniref:GGDEF domain-containing protein n=1 Tax=Pseudorhodoferax sp. Leaf274 TaxID=1736318 RepID=UPI00070318A7|nr:GGDEF domain-containing protein [Pseudorhodoferax sp. Leaf274]KQP39843.1 hypothetical protein ASF44_09000 [Pseudorhodoferax sp. Leaf274]
MDPATVVTLLAFNLIGIGSVLLLIGRHTTDAAGLQGFGTGALAFGAGYLLRLVLGFSSGDLRGVGADVCMVYATLCFATGLRQFSGGAPLGRRRVLTVTGGYVLLAVSATLLWQGVGRHALLNLFLGAAYLLLAYLAVVGARREKPALRLPMRVLAGTLVLIGLATVARGVLVPWVGLAPLFTGPAAQAYYTYSVVFSTVLGPSLLWMVFLRLSGRLQELATHDALTGVLNRNGLQEAMRRHFGGRPAAPVALMAVDVDHFKRINDGHGHGVGDMVLRGVAQALQAGLRGGDTVARWGGEEFMVCCHGADGALALAERLRQGIEAVRHPLPGGGSLGCTVSIGVSLPFDRATDWESAARGADQALYEAKRLGRNRVQAAQPPQHQPAAAARLVEERG